MGGVPRCNEEPRVSVPQRANRLVQPPPAGAKRNFPLPKPAKRALYGLTIVGNAGTVGQGIPRPRSPRLQEESDAACSLY